MTSEATGDGAVALKLWVVLARAYDAVASRAAVDIARHGLTPAEFGVLEALYHKGPLLLGEVQRKVLISSGGITYVVDRLEQKGLVERQPSPNDRRARFAALTRSGKALMRKIFPEHAGHMKDVLSGLNVKDQRAATELLRKLGRYAADMGSGATPD